MVKPWKLTKEKVSIKKSRETTRVVARQPESCSSTACYTDLSISYRLATSNCPVNLLAHALEKRNISF